MGRAGEVLVFEEEFVADLVVKHEVDLVVIR